MRDIPEKAVEAAAHALATQDDPDACGQAYFEQCGGPNDPAREFGCYCRKNAHLAVAAALPHLASAQPQPILPERLAELEKRLGKRPWPANFAGMNRDIALELLDAAKAGLIARTAALAECEALARNNRLTGIPPIDNLALINAVEVTHRITRDEIADDIAALRAPAEKESAK